MTAPPPRDYLTEALAILRGDSMLLAQREHLLALVEGIEPALSAFVRGRPFEEFELAYPRIPWRAIVEALWTARARMEEPDR